MPRPLRKRSNPEPQPITIRRIGATAPVEVVSPDELHRRKEEAEWAAAARRRGLDLRHEHERLALGRGATVTIPTYTADLWWFVRDVNGIDRTVTAASLIFDQVRERTFPFELVEPLRLWHAHQRNEADSAFTKIESRLPARRVDRRTSSRAA